MIQPRRNEWSSCSYTTDSSIFSSSSSSSSSYIHKCTIQFNTHNWSSTLILSLLSTKSFLNLLTFTTTTTQRRRYYTFSNQTKKSTNAQTLQRKTTVLVPVFFFSFGFPSTHYQSRQSWFQIQEQLGCFICIPVCCDHIPREYPDGHDEFQNWSGRPQAMKTRGARNSRRPCGQARGPPHGTVPFFLFFIGLPAP